MGCQSRIHGSGLGWFAGPVAKDCHSELSHKRDGGLVEVGGCSFRAPMRAPSAPLARRTLCEIDFG